MNIQERVLTALKPLVASKGFGATTVEGLATNLSASLSEESTDEDITTAINGAMPLFNIMQSENTRYVNEWKKKNPTPANPTPAPQPTNPNPTNTEPAPNSVEAKLAELENNYKKLLEQNQSLSLKEKWNKLAEANGINNETLISKWQPSKEEDFDSAMEELKAFSTEFVKKAANDKSPGRPGSGTPTDPDPKKPKELTSNGKAALEGFKKSQERHAKKA
ncbi:hypothetical protein AAW12_08685 [Sphingobacterium sp. Ag1]|uniref:hypothetical protein n=1 Tax=Sphingobacterium sp. Ag1 TaxID=1643451 RepID=UPI000627D32D|nr:hypothetical protein [Sphingobacterium sp. Ag1]KKO91728.1 hypothetical protein AAW12_08685 [Sphingobacterium sp. Ag1]